MQVHGRRQEKQVQGRRQEIQVQETVGTGAGDRRHRYRRQNIKVKEQEM